MHPNRLLCCLSLCISLVSYFYATLGLVWQNLLLYRIVAGKIKTKQCLFPFLHSRTESAKGGKRFMSSASYVLTLPSLRAKSIRGKKWSQSSEWETIGHNGFCNPLLQIKRNPPYRLIIYASKVLEQYFTTILFWVFFCTVGEWNLLLSYGTVRGERVTVPTIRSCLKQPFPKPSCQAFEEEN